MSRNDSVLDLIDAAIYSDLFDCAVTFDELWRFSRTRASRSEFKERIDDPQVRSALAQRGDYYCLHGREHLADSRPERRARARRLHQRARRVVRWLQHLPFVRGALLTGSVAAEDAEPEADIDLLLVVASGRLSLVFLLLGSFSRLTSRAIFCPNYYLSEAHLSIDRRSHYVAREVAQAKALTPCAGRLSDSNTWMGDHLPNATPDADPVRPFPGGRALQWLFEAPLRGRLGDRLEAWARELAMARLRHHHGLLQQPVPPKVEAALRDGIELRFHASMEHESIDERYQARRRDVARLMETAETWASNG